MSNNEFKIGDIVYHRSVYEHKEALKVVGITEDKLLLEGDYSGGTHNVVQRDWLPIKGTSIIKNYALKERARENAYKVAALYDSHGITPIVEISALLRYVLEITRDVELNPEF